MVVTIDATTLADLVQQPVVEMSEKLTQVDITLCPQTSHAFTQMVSPYVVTTNETSTQTDGTPSLQTRHVSTKTPQSPIVTTSERSTQTDRAPRPWTVQAATQTDPPSRNYQDELKAQISLAKLSQQRHNEAIGQLREAEPQATTCRKLGHTKGKRKRGVGPSGR